ncbi:MAG: hypothetical protein ACI8W8_001829 [Rhodothermales bacterium]|jgi:hypothetical protein
MIRFLLIALFFLPSLMADEFTLVFEGKEGPGKGKHIVLVSGDEEYRTEESMPMLAKILSQHHGFKCTVVFAWSADGKYIDPNNQAGLRGLAALDSADLMLIGTRFRKPSASEAAHVTAFLNAKKPVIGIRTATHAFNGGGKFGNISYGQFGRLVLGEQWVSHHGRHKGEGARGVIEEANASHVILNSVKDVFAPSDVYGVKHLTDADTVLLRGAVTETLDPASKPVAGKKNEPMQALAWLHTYKTPDGSATGTSFCTTAGASVDLVSEDLRRLLVNATYHLTGLTVPEKANVDHVDPFKPSFYGFCKGKEFWAGRNLTLADFALGVGVKQVDPKGSPEWNFR